LTLLAGLLPAPDARAASKSIEVENVRVGFQERFKVGTWTPMWIQLRGGIEPFSGVMEVIANDENDTPTTIRQVVQVGAGASQRVTAYVRTGSNDSDFATLRFIDDKTGKRVTGDVVIGNLLQGANARAPIPLTQDDYQILALGRPSGVESIPTLAGFNASKSTAAAGGRAIEVAVARLSTIDDLLPGRWYGYEAADVVVVDTNDKEMLATLASGRGEALRGWVERGGHLVVAVSSNWQAVNDSILGPMLPAKLNGQTQVTPFDSLESFTGASTHQAAFENTSTRVAKFEDVEARGGRVIASTLSTPLVVRGPYGFGRVTLVGMDVDAQPFIGWPDRALFWVKTLDLRSPATGADTQQKQQQRFFQTGVNDLATSLRNALEQFQGVTLIPFGWVAGFIVLYILMIGPGDYFFLKKVLKRMELTWITFPTIVVTVSLLAYYAAYLVKGTDLRVNKVDVLDLDLESGRARGTTWANVFSPRNHDYNVTFAPLPLEKDVPTDSKDPKAAPPAPVPGTEVMTTWFAAPEAALRGTGRRGGGGMGFGGGGYSYAPLGKAEELEDVRIGIWSTKCFTGRWFGPGPAANTIVETDIQSVGGDRLAGKITNKLPYPLLDTMVIYGKQVYYRVGTIAPGASIEVASQLDRTLSSELSDQENRNAYLRNLYYNGNDNRINRDKLMRAILFHDSDLTDDAVPSRTLHELDLTGQLALGRPMLVARVDRPAAQLVLRDNDAEAKTDQTTLIRLILPLSSKGEAKPSKPK
jgi:hypothetical protein